MASRLLDVAHQYPEELVDSQLADIERVAFNISLVIDRRGTDVSIWDIGGGIGLFSVGCSALGMRVTLVDDFRDEVNQTTGKEILALHARYGVRVLECDVLQLADHMPVATIDVVTTFHCVEHLHHSPKRLLAGISQALVKDGLFIMGTPNCVNLRKRVCVPLGRGSWSSLEEWYESTVFRGHVREPSVPDLRFMASDMGLCDIEIVGRNWLGYRSPSAAVRWMAHVLDPLMRRAPSLCSDLYVLGRKA